MATRTAGQHNLVMKPFKQSLADVGKLQKLILVGIMRKLLSVLKASIKYDQPRPS